MGISKEHRAELERLKHEGLGDTEHYAQLEALAVQAGEHASGPKRDDAKAHEFSKRFNDLAKKKNDGE